MTTAIQPKNRKLDFKDEKEMEDTLQAKDRGRYLLCSCPDCDKKEAFIYKNNPNFIRCNRTNECGYKGFIKYGESGKTQNWSKEENKRIGNPMVAKDREYLTKMMDYIQNGTENPAFVQGYRGINENLIRDHGADMVSQKVVSTMFTRTKSLYDKDYSRMDRMTERNIVFPIKGEDGKVDALMMRSSINPNTDPKEIQINIHPDPEKARDFIMDVTKEQKTVAIGESILDTLSLKEVDNSIGIIGLTGSQKTRKATEYITNNTDLFKDKSFFIATDNDKAGRDVALKLGYALEKEGLPFTNMKYQTKEKDPNEMLQKNRSQLEKAVHQGKQDNVFALIPEHAKEIIVSPSLADTKSIVKNRAWNNEEVGIITTSKKGSFKGIEAYLQQHEQSFNHKNITVKAVDNGKDKLAEQVKGLVHETVDTTADAKKKDVMKTRKTKAIEKG